jgi:hypothetical protein
MAFVILCALIGIACAVLNGGVLLILAASVLLAVVGTLGAVLLHAPPWGIAAVVFGSVAVLQSAYTAAGLTLHLVLFGKLILPAPTAIGRHLGAQLEVPRTLPPELSVLVARLRASRTTSKSLAATKSPGQRGPGLLPSAG